MSRPLKGLLIGAGFFSRNHLHAWTEVEGAEIAAICDRDLDRAEAAAKEFGIAEWYDDASVLNSGPSISLTSVPRWRRMKRSWASLSKPACR
ncbi:Gfo/Idh/MocA family oxidoreductase [Mesorhizobium sp. BAC0120]|uniref:Gfo/Idh/MocA family oxidoreductase n=1 Tax=Mesorhizobium sp. BAC0120 TaxID=3090670 RepID=UPI00298BFAF0|nr:Gfo/Idh/MocA family oxidoreductase [Mesorhizobium sp. BAC0120]MDW6023227.1 Gfo/Idh/MocA family oxidoreductase [Mesorhizobium sp. BAC0120]